MKKLTLIQNLLLRGIYGRDEILEYLCRCANIGASGVKLYYCFTISINMCGYYLISVLTIINTFEYLDIIDDDTLLWSFIISLTVGIPIGYRIGKYAQSLVREIAKCPKCQETTLNLTKEDIVTENTIRNIEGQGKNRKAVHYRVGNKTAFFQCGSCGYEDSLNTPYKEKIY
ncbi:hypothetical protein [Helicobacter japonicus]|uniref:hypothetical protein n=1 Tax=Helicobacter japonicus TaxID=425400 RepID=UPI0023F051B6|nr:hypothetical protein [Helicobacter japonicus]